MKRVSILTILLFLLSVRLTSLYAQRNLHTIDSLEAELSHSGQDTARVNILLELGWEYGILRNDTAVLNYLTEAVELGRFLDYSLGLAKALSRLGTNYLRMRQPDVAATCANEALILFEQIGETKEISKVLIVLGESEALKGNMVAAEEYMKSSLTKAEETGDLSVVHYSTQNLAKFYRLTRRFDESITYHEKSLLLAKQLHDPEVQGHVYYSLAALYFNLGKNEEGLEACTSALEIYKVSGSTDNLALTYNMMGLMHQKAGTFPDALHYFQLSLEMKETTGDYKGIGLAYRNMAITYVAMNMYEEAIALTHKKIDLMKQHRDTIGLFYTYSDFGLMYINKGEYVPALKYYLLAADLQKSRNETDETAGTYNSIGHVYFKQRNYEKALEYYKAALVIREKSWSKFNLAISYYNLCNVYSNMDSLDQALVAGEKSLELMQTVGAPVDIARVHNFLGVIHMKKGQYIISRFYLDTSLLAAEKISPEESKWILINSGDLRLRMAEEAFPPSSDTLNIQAKIFFEKAYTVAYDGKDPEVMIEAYRGLSEVYTRQGAYEKALEYLSKYTTLKDSLFSNENTRQVEQLRTQYEVDKAVALEKTKQDSLLTEQRFQTEREQAEIEAKHQLEIAEAKAQQARAIVAARYRYLLQLAAAETEQEKQLAEQQYQNDLRIAEENARHQIALAQEKANQQRREAELAERQKEEKAERERKAQMAMAGSGILGVFILFFGLYRRQQNLKQKVIVKAEIAHQMAELELQSLRAQLNPHFMFNSLNAIQELILMEENDKSHTYLARFAKLLRMLLENANSPFIPLARELEFLQLYLSLEKLRVPDLTYQFDIDPVILTEQIKIPNMILQPYIENAIWHGLSHKKSGERKILIRVNQDSMGVKYEIEDNGVGRKMAAELKSAYRKAHRSKGMELLTRRFRLLSDEYRKEINTEITDLSDQQVATGTRVAIRVPWEMSREVKQTA